MFSKVSLKGLFVTGLVIAFLAIFTAFILQDQILEGLIKSRLDRCDESVLSDPGIHVIMVGTGTPNYDPVRNAPCVAVIAGGEFLLFDTGDGCARTLDSMNLPFLKINTVFLTHYHSDHINGLINFISHTWIHGRKKELHVYGPVGVKSITDGAMAFLKEDIGIRANPQALFPLDRKLVVVQPHEFSYPGDGSPLVVWKKNGLIVTAFKNDHADVKISCGYRIEYANRSVVISGDTVKSDYVIQNSRDTDILIHEAVNLDMIKRIIAVLNTTATTDADWTAEHLSQVSRHHCSTRDVAKVAAEANVKRLLLYHIGPGIPDNWFFEKMYLKDMRGIYDGPVSITTDRDRFYLEPGRVSHDI
ncbi:MAG: hypothetical protein CVV44_11245 [Spirochaetae bacterium HGW-Spirochaetae-1]|jgi:ribonuclease Z|nr:MAG: hypothetical protein CVV44_11245 [Spirochaetae bacterium HGW-Spirochaetae-1]